MHLSKCHQFFGICSGQWPQRSVQLGYDRCKW